MRPGSRCPVCGADGSIMIRVGKNYRRAWRKRRNPKLKCHKCGTGFRRWVCLQCGYEGEFA